jgi:hypothetical protein
MAACDITEFCGYLSKLPTRLNQKIFRHVEPRRYREVAGDLPYMYL